MHPDPVDTVSPRRGIWMFPGTSAEALVDAVVAAEDLGLDEVWVADEGVARDPFALLAAAAGRTTRIRLATGITSPLLRHPGAIAASIATIDELSRGRAVLGLGVGGHLALTPFGIEADRPVGRLREAIEIVRAVHSGTPTSHYDPPPHAAPSRSVPLWVGARGPQLVRLATRLADGLFLSGCTPGELETIAAGVSGAGGTDLAVYQSAVDRPSGASEMTWDAAVDALATAARLHSAAAIGINLVESAAEGTDPVALVERAAQTLLAV